MFTSPSVSETLRAEYCKDRLGRRIRYPNSLGRFFLSLSFFGYVLYLPRKEVIQPHLPVRLPCYDFTPLTPRTFDASAPFRFGRRLRVQTTRVV